MKELILLTACFFTTATLLAQTPMSFKYQAVARDADSEPYANTNLGIRFTILQGGASGSVVYSETHTEVTSDLGVFTTNVGEGTAVSGDMHTIDWASGAYHLKVDLDMAGGSDYTFMGSSELLAVPFAMYAASSGSSAAPDHEWDGTSIRFEVAGGWGEYTDLRGAEGPQGDAGATGPKGDDGAPGLQGEIGSAGDKGEQGEKGEQGDPGTPGEAGPAPDHQWNGTELRFRNADDTWGTYTDLEGSGGGSSVWEVNGNKAYYEDGNAGVGTDDPKTNFEVSGTDHTKFRLTSKNANTTSLQLFKPGNTKIDWGIFANSDNKLRISSSDDDLSALTTRAAFFPNGDIRLGSSPTVGHVAIGTEPSDAKLSINYKSASGKPSLQINQTDNSLARIYFTNSTSADRWVITAQNKNTGSSRMAFHNGGYILSMLDLQYDGAAEIVHSGRIGINKHSPVANLHVQFPKAINNAATKVNGFRLENNGANDHHWHLYVNDGANGRMDFIANGTKVGSFNAATGAYSSISDERLKSDIKELSPVLSKITELPVRTYIYDHARSSSQSIGFLAQDVAKSFPELASNEPGDGGEEMYTVNYAGMSAVAIKAIQEQQKMILDMQEDMQEMKRIIEELRK